MSESSLEGEGLNHTEDVNHAVTNDEGKEQHLAVQTQSILVALCWPSQSPLIMECAWRQLPKLFPHCPTKNGMIKLSKWRVKCEPRSECSPTSNPSPERKSTTFAEFCPARLTARGSSGVHTPSHPNTIPYTSTSLLSTIFFLSSILKEKSICSKKRGTKICFIPQLATVPNYPEGRGFNYKLPLLPIKHKIKYKLKQ